MRQRKAFTLIELLVVVAIIALLVAILVPSIIQARELANRAVCQSNLHQIVVGLHMYYEDWRKIPPNWPPTLDEPWGTYRVQSGYPVALGTGYATGLGMLYHGGYIEAVETYWCPSTEFPFLGNLDKKEHIELLVDLTTPGTVYAACSYYLRTRTGYNYIDGDGQLSGGQRVHVITIEDWTGSLSAVADQHTYPKEDPAPHRSIHKVGFNAVYWDGSARWVSDPDAYHSGWWWYAWGNYEVEETMWWLADNPTSHWSTW